MVFGRIFANLFSAGGQHRAVAFIAGFAGAYAMTNPDMSTAYDLFPTNKQDKFAFITYYKVLPEHEKEFETSVKSLYRYFQQQKGYLFTKLIKSKEFSEASYQYIAVSLWYTADYFRLAESKPVSQRLVSEIPGGKGETILHKTLVDDSEYNPI